MFEVELSKDFLTDQTGTSEGTQDKYYKDGWWYKQDSVGNESVAEVLSSVVLSCSSLSKQDYVLYEYGFINHKTGCRSRDFLKPGETLITLYRFYEQLTGQKLNEVTNHLETPSKRAKYTINFFQQYANLDLTDYFRKAFTIDLINLNEDRHFNNLAIIRKIDGTYHSAPLFDHGRSLFVGNVSVNPYFSFEENRKRIISRPFSGNPETQYKLFPNGFTIDFAACRKKLKALEKDLCVTKEYNILQQNLEFSELPIV